MIARFVLPPAVAMLLAAPACLRTSDEAEPTQPETRQIQAAPGASAPLPAAPAGTRPAYGQPRGR